MSIHSNKTRNRRRPRRGAAARWSTVLAVWLATGCSQQALVSSPYPRWGQTFELPGATPEQTTHMQWLAPVSGGEPSGCLLIVHGMNEYIGRYGDIARHFSGRFRVAGFDLTAHGLSNPVFRQGQRALESGQPAFDSGNAFLEQRRLRNLDPMRADLGRALRQALDQCDQNTAEPLPVFILSHSLGSLVSASYLLQNRDGTETARVRGIIFSGPAFSVTEVPGWRGWFQNPLIRFSYHTHRHFLNPQNEALPLMLFNQLLALVTVPLQDGLIELLSLPGIRSAVSPVSPDWVVDYLSDWEAERRRHREDAYIIRRTLLRYVLAVEREIIAFRRVMKTFDIPYLLIYSEHDPITPAWGPRDFAAQTLAKHHHNQLLALTGASHHEHLFSTPALRQEILRVMDAWLTRRLTED